MILWTSLCCSTRASEIVLVLEVCFWPTMTVKFPCKDANRFSEDWNVEGVYRQVVSLRCGGTRRLQLQLPLWPPEMSTARSSDKEQTHALPDDNTIIASAERVCTVPESFTKVPTKSRPVSLQTTTPSMSVANVLNGILQRKRQTRCRPTRFRTATPAPSPISTANGYVKRRGTCFQATATAPPAPNGFRRSRRAVVLPPGPQERIPVRIAAGTWVRGIILLFIEIGSLWAKTVSSSMMSLRGCVWFHGASHGQTERRARARIN